MIIKIQTENFDRACVGLSQPQEHVDDGRLAGPIRPDNADDLAWINLERDAIDGFESFEKFGDGFDFDDRLGHPP